MSKPCNRKKNKKQEPPRSPPPPTSNRVEHGTFTQGKITVTLKIKYNDNYLDLNKNKKEKIFYVVMQYAFYQMMEWYEKVQYKI